MAIYRIVFVLALLVACASSFDINKHEALFQCLLNHSESSNPISGAIYTPNNASYSSVLEAYIRNLRFNESSTPKPLLILTALHESHVQTAVVCAKRVGIQMKIRSGGHDYEGISYVSEVEFFVLDMFNLRDVNVDVGSETAWVQTGATLGEVYYRIAERSRVHGFPAGVCPTVGVGGHFSGGGYGNLMRKYGLTVDNVVDAKLVDVNGRILDRKSMGEDLFWAITGGGGASFGVVLSYQIHLVKVPEVVTVFRAARTQENDSLADIVYRYQQVAPSIDDDLFIRVTFDVTNKTRGTGRNVRATFRGMFLGDSQRLFSIVNESFPELGLLKSDCIEMSWVESVLFWTDFPTGTPTTALLSRTPPLSYLKRKSDYLQTPIPNGGLEGIWKKMIELQVPQLTFNPYGGKMAEIASTAKPFPHRAGNLFKLQYATNWNVSGVENANYYINLTRELHRYLTPYVSKNPRQAFSPYRDLDIGINHNGKGSYYEGKVYGIKYFKANFDRLVRIKTEVDPENLFWNEQSIPVLSVLKQVDNNVYSG